MAFSTFKYALPFLLCAVAFGGVNVSAPANGVQTGTSVQFVASASSNNGRPITSMMIYIDNQNRYLVYANALNTPLQVAAGSHNAIVKAWDSGGTEYDSYLSFNANAQGTGASGVTVSSPSAGSTTGTSVHFVASASSATQYPITSMLIYIDDQPQYTVYSNNVDTYVGVGAGNHTAVVKSWDASGQIYSQTVPFVAANGGGTNSGSGGVTVSSPTSGATLGTSAHFVASAASADSHPITSMVIYVDDQSMYTVYANSLDTYLNLNPGNHTAVVKSWNAAGAMYTQSVAFAVGSGGGSPLPPSGNAVSDIQSLSSWASCSVCAGAGANGPTAQYSMTQHVGSPSMDGNATQFWLGNASAPYGDAIWWKAIPAQASASHFTYDLYFYMDNPNASEALEWDVNVAYQNHYYLFGAQCSPRWSNTWDTWDENSGSWNSTGISCPTFPAYQWNHVTIELERTWDNYLHYIAITFNGNRHYVDRYVASKPTGYSDGVTVDFQMDGDYNQENYSVWLDKVSLSYY